MSVGSQIRRAREAAGLTIAELSELTKIRASLLEAMERDDFAAAGGDVYVRMQLRTIAGALGVEPERFTGAYAEDTQPIPVISGRREARVASADRGAMISLSGIDWLLHRRRGANWTAAMVVALGAAVAVVVAIVLLGRGSSAPPAADPPSLAALTSSSGAPPTQVPPASAVRLDDTTTEDSGVTLTIAGTSDRSWISVSGDSGAVMYEGLVQAGETKTFRDPIRVRVSLGDAGAVTLTVNGVSVGTPGDAGEVRSLEFTPDDPPVSLS